MEEGEEEGSYSYSSSFSSYRDKKYSSNSSRRSRSRDRDSRDRSKSRSKSRDRDNYQRSSRDNKKYERNSKSKSKSRSRSRSRTRSRSPDNRYSKYNNNNTRYSNRDYSDIDYKSSSSTNKSYYKRSSSRSRSRSRSNERRRDRDYNNQRKKSNLDEPTSTIMLKGLNYSTTEEGISDAIKVFSAYESISLKFDKKTGKSRGFAFVEFKSVDMATSFIKETKGFIEIDDKKIHLEYGLPEIQYEWLCDSCNASNFAHRPACYKCKEEKPENPRFISTEKDRENNNNNYYSNDNEPVPSNTLVILDCKAEVTEDIVQSTIYLIDFNIITTT